MQPYLSVIIPIYRVEKYIERCARSLFEQNLDNIEYLFIDDCTPDKSIEILQHIIKEYPERQNLTRILRMPANSGQAKVRNYGISEAKGEYIIHCDSDDWIDTSMYCSMYLEAKKTKADVVVCDYLETDGNLKKVFKAFPKYSGELSNNLKYWISAGQLWNKMYKSSIYHSDIILPQNNMGEDMALVYQMAYYCKRISYIQQPYYHFFQNAGSITHSKSIENQYRNFTDICRNVKIIEEFYGKHLDSPEIGINLKRIKYQEREKLLPLIKIDKAYYKVWRDCFPEVGLNIFFKSEFTFKEKIKYLLIRLKLFP